MTIAKEKQWKLLHKIMVKDGARKMVGKPRSGEWYGKVDQEHKRNKVKTKGRTVANY